MKNFVKRLDGMNIALFEYICGTCKFYDSDTLFCDIHPEYGELVEQDTCDDWSEDSEECD